MTPLIIILGSLAVLSLGATAIILAGCMLTAHKTRALVAEAEVDAINRIFYVPS
jgi:hypothetical protein